MFRFLSTYFSRAPLAQAEPCVRGEGNGAPSTVDVRGRLRERRRRRSQRGVALIMVLGTLTILTVMLTEFQDETSAELGSAMSARDSVRAEYAAKSAVNLTRLLIASEPTVRSSLSLLFMALGKPPPQIPVWEYSDKILGAFGDSEGGAAFASISGVNLAEGRNLGMENAGFRILVVDEDAKINLNLAAHPGSQQRAAEIIRGLFNKNPTDELFSSPDDQGSINDRYTICSALIDWADPDDKAESCDPANANAPQTGNEDSYYQLLSKPYQRKNAGFDSLEELHMVRGITDDLYDRYLDPDPDDPRSRNVTVWGGQKGINVNTSNPETLLALICSYAVENTPLCTDPTQQMMFLTMLGMLKTMAVGVPVFPSEKDFLNLVKGQGQMASMLSSVPGGFQPITLTSDKMFEDAITVESKVFSIYATGYVKNGKKETQTRIHAVIDMRGAPPPGVAQQTQLAEAAAAATGTPGGQTPAPGTSGTDTTATGEAGSLASALAPNPGGAILYYRVD